MSRLNELIQELCSDGVEFKRLGDLGVFENIGVDKKIIQGQSLVTLLNYVDVYKNMYIDNSIPKMIVSASINKIHNCSCEKGDIFITPTSETKNDIGHASVIRETLINTVYSYHIMRFRLIEVNMTSSFFIRYLFETEFVKKQIYKLSKGLTRFGLSKYDFAKIEIPYPPLDVQNEIVSILDTFTSHTAELQAELQAREEQYEYYRNKLFDSKIAIEKYKLSDVCIEIGDGLHGTPLYDEKGDYYFINGNNLVKGRITFNTQTKKINYNEFQRIGLKFSTNVVFLSINGTIGNVALYNNEQIALGKSVAYFVVNPLLLNVKFLYYYFLSKYAKIYFELNSTGSTIKNLGLKALRNMIIPIPSLSEQQRIVSILDKFEALVNDLTEGTPAEIAAVQEQYEYYRNKLLTFKQRA